MVLPKVFLSCGVCKASGSGPLSNDADDTGVVIVTSNTKKVGLLLSPSSGDNEKCSICLGPFWKDETKEHGQENEPFAGAAVISEGKLPPVQLATTKGEIPRSIAILDCEHVFHVQCIAGSINSIGPTCPVCRAKIEDWDVSSIIGVYDARKAIETPPQRGSPPSAIPRHMQTPGTPSLVRQESFFIDELGRQGRTPEQRRLLSARAARARRPSARAEPGPRTYTPEQAAARQRRFEQMLADVNSLNDDDNWADNVQNLLEGDDPGASSTLEDQIPEDEETPGNLPALDQQTPDDEEIPRQPFLERIGDWSEDEDEMVYRSVITRR